MNELALFAGAGGGILGGHLLGWRTVCAVELDAYAASVLAQRQNDGILEAFPIWSDVRSFDGNPWRGIVDVVSGGFPCQDISAAGKGAGINGERSGLWHEMSRIIREVRPRYAFVENSPILTSRGLGVVLGDLAEMGFDAEWGVFAASDLGAPHERERIWILGHAMHSERRSNESAGGYCDQRIKAGRAQGAGEPGEPSKAMEYAESKRRREGRTKSEILSGRNASSCSGCEMEHAESERSSHRRPLDTGLHPEPWSDGEIVVGHDGSIRLIKPGISPLANGVARRVERIRTTGNGQVPCVAALAWTVLFSRITASRSLLWK